MILTANNITRSFFQGEEAEVKALDNINFSIKESEQVAITGPSGSGKTTLLSLMAGLDTPSSGEITIKGTSLSQLNELELSEFRAKNIGIIFQQFHLLEHLSALENVSLPLEIQGTGDHKEYRERAAQMLAQVGLDHRLNHFPTQLSGGEKQRVAIARAAIIKPSILLADEPSGNLDTQTGKQIMDLLFNLSNEHNVTLILVTHDLELARRCEREIHIRGGVIQ